MSIISLVVSLAFSAVALVSIGMFVKLLITDYVFRCAMKAITPVLVSALVWFILMQVIMWERAGGIG